MSGPASETVHARRTEQVLLQLISEARHEILLVTFALEMHDELHEALTRALHRGVRVTVLAEDPADYPGFRGDPGRAVRDLKVERLRWPAEARPERGAALHAKVVVVDRMTALVTSADLTQRASGDNLEAGVVHPGAGGTGATHRRPPRGVAGRRDTQTGLNSSPPLALVARQREAWVISSDVDDPLRLDSNLEVYPVPG